ncbi:hypothetical protein FACS18947_6950 [Bacteroidia bacterium]|nr:hypothetical protein FACS18947_6950 [Bacteroidia bacterium]
MLKKIVAVCVTFIFLLSVTACGSGSKPAATNTPTPEETKATEAVTTEAPTETAAPTEAPKSFVVGWSIDTVSTPFNAAEDEAVKEAWSKYPEVTLYSTEANADGLKQVSDVEDLVAKGADILMIKPRDEATLAEVLRNTVDKIPVVLIDRYIADDSCYTIYVGTDNVALGRMVAESLVADFDGKANICIAEGTAGGSSYLDRLKGINEVFAQYPDIKILSGQTSAAKRDEGKTLAENWITAYGDDLDAIIALTDEITMGVFQACEEKNRTDIKLYSNNGQTEALKEIMNEGSNYRLTAVFSSGVHPGVEVAWHILNNGTSDLPAKQIFIGTFNITAENAAEYYDESIYGVDFQPGGSPAVQDVIENTPFLKDLEYR